MMICNEHTNSTYLTYLQPYRHLYYVHYNLIHLHLQLCTNSISLYVSVLMCRLYVLRQMKLKSTNGINVLLRLGGGSVNLGLGFRVRVRNRIILGLGLGFQLGLGLGSGCLLLATAMQGLHKWFYSSINLLQGHLAFIQAPFFFVVSIHSSIFCSF